MNVCMWVCLRVYYAKKAPTHISARRQLERRRAIYRYLKRRIFASTTNIQYKTQFYDITQKPVVRMEFVWTVFRFRFLAGVAELVKRACNVINAIFPSLIDAIAARVFGFDSAVFNLSYSLYYTCALCTVHSLRIVHTSHIVVDFGFVLLGTQ